MQAIAAENNLSETAFTVPSERDDADYDLRWFTPTVEVDLCGHATLAAAHILLHGKLVRFATQSGILTVTREADLLQLDLPAALVEPADLPDLLERSASTGADVPSAATATAVPSSLLADEAAVRAVTPDFAALDSFAYWRSSPRRATSTASPAGFSSPTTALTRIR